MATLADNILPIANRARAIAGKLGFRQHSASLVEVTFTGSHPGSGVRVENAVAIVEADGQNPKIHWHDDEERALGGLQSGSMELTTTPAFAGGGTSIALLSGANLAGGVGRYLLIAGPNHPDGALYRIKSVDAQKALKVVVVAEPASVR